MSRLLIAANGDSEPGTGFNIGDKFLLDPVEQTTVAEKYANPAALINTLLPNIYVAAGIILFVFVLGAGFRMIMNPDDKKAAEGGKKAIGYAIGGFVLLIAVYWIVQIIEVVTGVQILGTS